MNSRFLISFQAFITEKESLTGKEKKGIVISLLMCSD